jgi:hypothetical protein
MEERLEALDRHPNVAAAKELLRVWSCMSLADRLPLYIFNPELVYDTQKSLKDLVSDASIFKSCA